MSKKLGTYLGSGIVQSKFHERQKFGGHYKSLKVEKIDEEDEIKDIKNFYQNTTIQYQPKPSSKMVLNYGKEEEKRQAARDLKLKEGIS